MDLKENLGRWPDCSHTPMMDFVLESSSNSNEPATFIGKGSHLKSGVVPTYLTIWPLAVLTCSGDDIAVLVSIPPQLEAPGEREVAWDLNWTHLEPGVDQVILCPAVLREVKFYGEKMYKHFSEFSHHI